MSSGFRSSNHTNRGRSITGRLYCTPKALWKLRWFLRDFLYDPDLIGRDEVDEKALLGLRGVVRISHSTVNGRSFLNLDGFAPASEWEELSTTPVPKTGRGRLMTFSYTQISQYLTCPRSYRYRYLDGWKEKDIRAAMLFGRCFEKAVAAYFLREDPAVVFFRSGARIRETIWNFRKSDSWDRLLRQGIRLLERFAQDNRIRIRQPTQEPADQDQSSRFRQATSLWPTSMPLAISTARGVCSNGKPRQSLSGGAAGLLALDPQLVCYSWITGISDVAMVAFVRKRLVEVQYLMASITEEQRQEFGRLGREHDPSNRNCPVPPAQRNPLPAERVRRLSVPRSVPGKAGTRWNQTHSSPGSDLDWLDVLDD